MFIIRLAQILIVWLSGIRFSFWLCDFLLSLGWADLNVGIVLNTFLAGCFLACVWLTYIPLSEKDTNPYV